ncbi:hypothetical protein BJX62DRAFT_205231 [Aspergillus germanicus]
MNLGLHILTISETPPVRLLSIAILLSVECSSQIIRLYCWDLFDVEGAQFVSALMNNRVSFSLLANSHDGAMLYIAAMCVRWLIGYPTPLLVYAS